MPWLLAACAQPAFEAPHQAVSMTDDGAAVHVTGDAALRVAVFLNEPWSGEQALFPGLTGLHAATVVPEADQQAGAGLRAGWELSAGPLAHEIPGAVLRALPSPMVVQTLAAKTLADGSVALALSNAHVIVRNGDRFEVRPWSAWWALGRHAGGLMLFLCAPVLIAALLRLWRRPLPGWLWPAVLAAVAAAALWARAMQPGSTGALAGEAPLPLFVLPERADALAYVDRHHGPGVRDLVEAIAVARREGEPLTILVTQNAGRDRLALQLTHLLRDVRMVRSAGAAPGGLLLRLLPDPYAERRAAQKQRDLMGFVPTPSEPEPAGDELMRSTVGVLLRVAERR
jgi:hypothetical protein